LLYGEQAKYFEDEIRPSRKHTKTGTVAMANPTKNLNGSQVTLPPSSHLVFEKQTLLEIELYSFGLVGISPIIFSH
jgi:peptidyl-prolyl cis-trans isomerase-like 4